MRALKLLGLAAEAETERWKAWASREGHRVLLAAIGGVFAIGAFIMAHVFLWVALFALVQPVWAALIVLVLDIVAALAFLLMARNDTKGVEEIAALELRTRALTAARDDMTILNGVWLAISLFRRSRSRF